MKESILDVLLYLFEHYIGDDANCLHDRDPLQQGLIEAGFSMRKVPGAPTERPPTTASAKVIGCPSGLRNSCSSAAAGAVSRPS